VGIFLLFQFLGTSGHGVCLNRRLPATLLDSTILIDCGEGTQRTLLEKGFDPLTVEIILLTHLHADHILGIVSLLWQFAFYAQRSQYPLIYVPEGMKIPLENVFSNSFSPFGNVKFDLRIRELPLDGKSITIQTNKKKYLMEWTPTDHIPLSYAYKFEKKIVIAGDNGNCKKLAEFVIGTEILVHEASFPDSMGELAHRVHHSTPVDVADLAHSSGVQKAYLYHVPDFHSTEEEQFVQHAQEIFPNLRILHDFETVSL
jgi:ribonuclease Z